MTGATVTINLMVQHDSKARLALKMIHLPNIKNILLSERIILTSPSKELI